MLSKYLIALLRIFIGATLFWQTIPRAEAQEFNANSEAPSCKNEQVVENKDSKPPVKKVEEKSKSDLGGEAENSSAQNEESCQTPATDETENIEDSSNGSSNDSDSSPGDSNPSEEPSSLSNGGSTDSHDINFSLDLNLGGGSTTSPDSSTETMPPETDQTDPSSISPSQNTPTSSEGGDSQELASPNPKPEVQKPHKNKAEKHQKKTHKKTQAKEQHLRQAHKKVHLKDKSHDNKPKRVKSRKHRPEQSLKRSLDKSSLPHRPKRDRKEKNTLKHSPRQNHPKSRHGSSDFQRQRSQFYPSRNRLRKSVSPTKVLRNPSRRMFHPSHKRVRH